MRAAFLVLMVLVPSVHQETGPPPLSTDVPPLEVLNPALPTLFLVGDSTVNVGTAGQTGWGQVIHRFFDTSRLNIVNYARGGRSSRTFITEGLWIRVLSAMKPGDHVLIQFGHNDGGELFRTTRPRGSLAGIGDETKQGTVGLTGTFEVVRTYGWYLRQYVADARARGATPVVCSLVPRNVWKDGSVVRDPYADWAAGVAGATGTAFIDLHAIVAARYEALGPAKVGGLFADARTHTTAEGAELNAEAVIEGLRRLKSPLVAYFSEYAAERTAR